MIEHHLPHAVVNFPTACTDLLLRGSHERTTEHMGMTWFTAAALLSSLLVCRKPRASPAVRLLCVTVVVAGHPTQPQAAYHSPQHAAGAAGPPAIPVQHQQVVQPHCQVSVGLLVTTHPVLLMCHECGGCACVLLQGCCQYSQWLHIPSGAQGQHGYPQITAAGHGVLVC
jgi:hypothetical protein